MRNLPVDRVTAGLLALSVAACTHTGPVQRPADFLTVKKPARVWVTRPDDSVIVVTHPTLRGDTLSGFAHDKYFEMPMADVKQVRATFPAVYRTALLAGAGVVALGLVVKEARGATGCAKYDAVPPGEDEFIPC